jgi:hypothetical protein
MGKCVYIHTYVCIYIYTRIPACHLLIIRNQHERACTTWPYLLYTFMYTYTHTHIYMHTCLPPPYHQKLTWMGMHHVSTSPTVVCQTHTRQTCVSNDASRWPQAPSIWMCMYVRMCVCVCIHNMYTSTMCTCIRLVWVTPPFDRLRRHPSACVCMYVCMYVCIICILVWCAHASGLCEYRHFHTHYTHTHIYTHTYTHLPTHT